MSDDWAVMTRKDTASAHEWSKSPRSNWLPRKKTCKQSKSNAQKLGRIGRRGESENRKPCEWKAKRRKRRRKISNQLQRQFRLVAEVVVAMVVGCRGIAILALLPIMANVVGIAGTDQIVGIVIVTRAIVMIVMDVATAARIVIATDATAMDATVTAVIVTAVIVMAVK
jgi:hypothetical protein